MAYSGVWGHFISGILEHYRFLAKGVKGLDWRVHKRVLWSLFGYGLDWRVNGAGGRVTARFACIIIYSIYIYI